MLVCLGTALADARCCGAMRRVQARGVGTVASKPDIAFIGASIEVQEASLASAREGAAKVARDMLRRLARYEGALDLNKDVKTTRFEARPVYESQRRKGSKAWTRVLVGFRVTNALQLRTRDLRKVGAIVDTLVGTAGDKVRIDAIRFGIMCWPITTFAATRTSLHLIRSIRSSRRRTRESIRRASYRNDITASHNRAVSLLPARR